MSRIGKKIIVIPKDVKVFTENEMIFVEGKYGLLKKPLLNYVQLVFNQDKLSIECTSKTKEAKSYHGLIRALIQNMIIGVEEPFSKTLITEGVGYKFQVEKTTLRLAMGYTHPIEFLIPQNLTIQLESPTKLHIRGIDKEKVGFFAAEIRAIKPPEPYKGKGIFYLGEKIIRKAGKTRK